MNILLILLVFTFSNCGIDQGWEGIKPLRANRSEIEQVLGKPDVDKMGFYWYAHKGARIRANFSSAPCSKDLFRRGDFKLPEGTVIEYFVDFEEPFESSKLDFDRQSYVRDSEGDIDDVSHLVSKDGTVRIVVEARNGIEYVGRIYFTPSRSETKKKLCDADE